MALTQRFINMTAYLSYPRMKAAFGLLSADQRREWLETIGLPAMDRIDAKEAYPWFAFAAIHYLEGLLRPQMRVLEFGAGYSTLWFAQRVAEVVSVERSPGWIRELNAALSRHGLDNAELIHFDGLGHVPGELAQADEQVVMAYMNCPQAKKEGFDIIVIDDVCRNRVLHEAVHWVKPGGLMILDDSEREAYETGIAEVNRMGWCFARFHGTPPYHFHEKSTTVWHKPTGQHHIAPVISTR